MSKNPKPDKHGRYRVRRRGDASASAYSTRRFDPERHVIVSGPASDTYGAALPLERAPRLGTDGAGTPPAGGTDNNPAAGGEES